MQLQTIDDDPPISSAEHVDDKTRSVRIWLICVYGMILAMVAIGGITRLTGSGLSMVEWHPLMGTLPPLDDVAWQLIFEKYQTSPQYQQVNQWMTLSDFKNIFMWEYLHRLLGRTIGLVFFFPMVWLWKRGSLVGVHRKRALIALFLGGSQGLLGWFMVKSGLVDRPEVSHFRLAAHLSLAFFVAQYVQFMWLSLGPQNSSPRNIEAEHVVTPAEPKARENARKSLWRWAWLTTSLTVLQIAYGAFMAGTRAGFLFATYPDMNGSYLPPGSFHMGGWLQDALHNPILIHVLHRSIGFVLATVALIFGWKLWRASAVLLQNDDEHHARIVRRGAWVLASVITLQFSLGIATVMSHVTIWVAVSHQVGGLLLLSTCTWLLFSLRQTRS